jgi:hypothetical protein
MPTPLAPRPASGAVRWAPDGPAPDVSRLGTTGAAVGIAVGAGVGVAVGSMISGGPPLSTWVVIGLGAGIAVSAARDEAARPPTGR